AGDGLRGRRAEQQVPARESEAGGMAEKTRTHESRTDEARKDDGKASHITAKNVTSQEAAFLDEHAGELSKTTLRARWVHTPDEHEDHPGETLATQSHDVIRR